MAEITSELNQARARSRPPRWWPSLAAVIALGVVATVVYVVFLNDDTTATRTRADGVVNALDVTVDDGAEVRGTLLAGTVSIAVRNASDGLVWTALGRLADGTTLDAAQDALASNATADWTGLGRVVQFASPLSALAAVRGPGDESTLTVSGVVAGDYVLVHLPLDNTAQPIWTEAELQPVRIDDGDVGALPTDATYTVRDGRLIGPAQLAAGPTDIGVINENELLSGLNVYRLTEPVDVVVDYFSSGGELDLSKAPIERYTLGADTHDDQVISLELTPGQWLIEKKPVGSAPGVLSAAQLVTVS